MEARMVEMERSFYQEINILRNENRRIREAVNSKNSQQASNESISRSASIHVQSQLSTPPPPPHQLESI